MSLIALPHILNMSSSAALMAVNCLSMRLKLGALLAIRSFAKFSTVQARCAYIFFFFFSSPFCSIPLYVLTALVILCTRLDSLR